jgi:hypothetical protein
MLILQTNSKNRLYKKSAVEGAYEEMHISEKLNLNFRIIFDS